MITALGKSPRWVIESEFGAAPDAPRNAIYARKDGGPQIGYVAHDDGEPHDVDFWLVELEDVASTEAALRAGQVPELPTDAFVSKSVSYFL
jgi:hypothetical protein